MTSLNIRCKASCTQAWLVMLGVILALGLGFCIAFGANVQRANAAPGDLTAGETSSLFDQSDGLQSDDFQPEGLAAGTALQAQATKPAPGTSIAGLYIPVLQRAQYRTGEFSVSTSSDFYRGYCLFDINGDGTPELVVDYCPYEAIHKAFFYTVSGNRAVYLGSLSASHGGCFANATQLFLSGLHMDSGWITSVYMPSSNSVSGATQRYGSSSDPLLASKVIGSFMKKNGIKFMPETSVWDYSTLYDEAIVKLPISKAKVSVPGVRYNGKAQKPKVTVKYGSKTLRQGVDYTLRYRNNKEPGTATVEVVGMGAYGGGKAARFIVAGTPSYAGATSMPVSSKASWKLKNCSLKIVKGTDVVSVKGNVVTAKKPGVARLAVVNQLGQQVDTKVVSVYKLSGKYLIQSSMKGKSNMCLDMEGESKSNGAQMIVWPKHGRANQQFTFALQSDGSYTVKSVNSGKLLDVNGGSTAWGANVIQWQANGGKNQRWKLTVDEGNRITFKNVNSGLVFDVNGGVAKAGSSMIQWGANNGLNQKWKLSKVK